MRRAFLAVPILPCLLVVSGGWAAEGRATDAVASLRSRAPGRIQIELRPGDGRLRSLRGGITPPSAGAPIEIAERFLKQNAVLLGIRADLGDLRLAFAPESPAGRHLRFAQTQGGLPVFDHGVSVHLAPDGRVVLVQSDLASAKDDAPAATLAPEKARQIALADYARTAGPARDKRGRPAGTVSRGPALRGPVGMRALDPESGLFAVAAAPAVGGGVAADESLRPAYRLTVTADDPTDAVEYLVDARSGDVLRRRSLVQDTHLTGHGRVFDPNPVNTLADTSLRDLGDADSPAFTPAYRTVELPGLTRQFFDLFGTIMLNGPYVRVNDLIELPWHTPTFSGTGDFFFTRDRLEFENVMVYFHIDRSQRYIQSLGFNNINNRPIKVDPHGLNGVDNSHYVGLPPGFGWIAFGEGGVDDAEDADVILHEYGHSIQDNTNPGAYTFVGETGAQGEGFGDYWAFSSGPTGPGAFDPECLAEWDFEGSCLRRLDSTKHYPEDIEHEVHADGEIWSSTLHDLFRELGKTTADRVVLQSHFLVPFFPKFCDGARALRDADDLLYGGAHRASIGSAEARHGFAGDFVVRDLVAVPQPDGTVQVGFSIANTGPCALGMAIHKVGVVCGDVGQGLDELVETDVLAAGASADFSPLLQAPAAGCFFRVIADAPNDEAETNEQNNVADSAH